MSSVKTASQWSTKSSRRKTSGAMSGDASPDSKCPICLDIFSNISYLDICLHKFCFQCIREWAKNKAECPLCKQPFNSIYHSIKSEQDFQKYDLRPSSNGSFGTFGGVRFRYRTTLTGVLRNQDTGVMFEASRTSAQRNRDRYLRHMMMRLAARKQAAREGREATKIREQEMVNFRRDLYRRGIRVRTVQDGGRSRDTSAKFYQRNPACLHRLVPWLKRELLVLYGPIGSLVNMVQHIIMSKITCFDVESEVFREELRPFLQGRTDHFLHEFICFAKSPFNMETHDQHAVYDCPARPSEEDSSSNSSVIAISEDEEHSEEVDQPRESSSTLGPALSDSETPGPSYATSEVSRAGHRLLLELDSDSSLEGEEEETKDFKNSLQQIDQRSPRDVGQGGANSQECSSSDSDECVIVGFVKARSERTPELIQLSSDSSSDSEDDAGVPPAPSGLSWHLPSSSPAASHASSPSGTDRSRVGKDHYHQFNSTEGYSSRYKTSERSDRKDRERRHGGSRSPRKRHKSKDRERRRRRSGSRERRHSSRSPVTVQTSERSHSYYRDRDLTPDNDRYHRRRDSYRSYHSYRHDYSHDSGKGYTEKQSYSHSSRRYSDRHSSNSRSRSRSRASRKHDRRYSCSPSGSRSPSMKGKFHHDKPGGKRKYKSRHLDNPSKDSRSVSCLDMDSSRSTKHKRKSKEKHRKKSKERSRRSSRSRSVEEEEQRRHVDKECSSERSRRHHKKKKKHKKKSKKHKSDDKCGEERSFTVITIDSDSSSLTNVCVNQVSSTTNRDNPVDETAADPEEPRPPTPELSL